MKISPHTNFSRLRAIKSFYNSLSWVIVAINIVILMIGYRYLTDENKWLRAQLALQEVKAAPQVTQDVIDRSCVAWLMQSDLGKARERICTSVVKQAINSKGK